MVEKEVKVEIYIQFFSGVFKTRNGTVVSLNSIQVSLKMSLTRQWLALNNFKG